MAKLFTTEHYQFAGNELIDALGAEGLRRHGDPTATAADGWIEAIYRHCQVTTIYGGTSEVLPRHHRRARPPAPPQRPLGGGHRPFRVGREPSGSTTDPEPSSAAAGRRPRRVLR